MRTDLNSVALTGMVDRVPLLTVGPTGTAQARATLVVCETGADGQAFRLYVGLDAYGKAADALGAVAEGDLVGVQGKLIWRKAATQDAKGTLAVLVSKLSVLAPALEGA